MNFNNVCQIKLGNDSEIELIKLGNSVIVYQRIPLYEPYEFKENDTITEVKTMVTKAHTDLSFMFFVCPNLVSVNTYDWNTSNVTVMNHMFCRCTNLETLDLSDFDTSSVTNMSVMFMSSPNLKTIGDISDWDTSNVTSMYNMFSNCSSLVELDLSNWNFNNLSKDLGVSGMFQQCTGLEVLNLSNWNIRKLTDTDVSYMLDGCTSLHTLRLDYCNEDTINKILTSSNFPTGTPTTGSGTGELRLLYCEERNAANIQLPDGWKFVYVTSLYRPYEFRNNTNIIKVETIVNKSHTDLDEMFSGCIALKSINSTEWDTSNVTNMRLMFWKCNSLESLDLNNWDTSKVTNMERMFDMFHMYTYDRSSLTSLIINEWDTSNVINMSFMFNDCNSLESLDLNNWNTSKVVNMEDMFSSCESLESLNISNWDINCVTDMSHMFFNCSSLTNLDLSNWKNIKNETDMSYMFYNCSALRELDLSNWNTIGVMTSMFLDCNNLEILHLNNWDKDMIKEIIRQYEANPPKLPTGTINGKTRKIYCKKANTVGLTAPNGWQFVYVD